MRRLSWLIVAVVAGGQIALAHRHAAAQGFFQGLFGLGGAAQGPPVASRQPPLLSPYPYRAPPVVPQRSREGEHRAGPGEPHAGRYRTICVRLCDGYYWPISHGTSRSSFYRDASVCRASCGEEARLFYHAASEPDTHNMTDVSGRAYTRLPTAYLYRKRQIEGCKCKPDPWAQSELDRHRSYALNDPAGRRPEPPSPAIEPPVVIAGAGQAQAGSIGPDAAAMPPQPAATGDTPPAASDPAPATPPDGIRTHAGPQFRPRSARGEPQGERRRAAPAAPRATVQRAALRAPAAGGGPFGLGAGAQKSRWPGD